MDAHLDRLKKLLNDEPFQNCFFEQRALEALINAKYAGDHSAHDAARYIEAAEFWVTRDRVFRGASVGSDIAAQL